ncbi:hypothetical protein [Natronorubrum sp. FCH18a]|uniref:hypothetical protein n=1 Tax=Natronorubrum sp. FCH18a TaxID=3447018 RepID=UPI003F50E926
MQFKPVPEPPSNIEAIRPILEAVPTRAGAVDDCCQHLLAETHLETRSEAETWLTFLRALELVTADPAGYRRCSGAEGVIDGASPDSDRLQRAFRARVYGVDSVLEILERAETPLSTEEVVAEFHQQSTASDRRSNVGRNRLDDGVRVHRLLEWAALLGLGERTDDGRYR